MCKSKAEGGLRCSTHARERLNKAVASGNPERVEKARHEWELTDDGIAELKKQGKGFEADLRTQERDAIKAAVVARKINKAKNEVDTVWVPDERRLQTNARSPYELDRLSSVAIGTAREYSNGDWSVDYSVTDLPDGRTSVQFSHTYKGVDIQVSDPEGNSYEDFESVSLTQEQAQSIADNENEYAISTYADLEEVEVDELTNEFHREAAGEVFNTSDPTDDQIAALKSQIVVTHKFAGVIETTPEDVHDHYSLLRSARQGS